MSDKRVVYIVHGASGTCPSDSWEWVQGVYERKEDAEQYVADHAVSPEPKYFSGPWYEIKEHEVIAAAPTERRTPDA